MKRYEIGTQAFKQMEDCLECAKRMCDDIIKDERMKAYIRDTKTNKIIYGNYFEWTK